MTSQSSTRDMDSHGQLWAVQGLMGLGKPDYQGPVHRKMVKFNPGLSVILSMAFLSENM